MVVRCVPKMIDPEQVCAWHRHGAGPAGRLAGTLLLLTLLVACDGWTESLGEWLADEWPAAGGEDYALQLETLRDSDPDKRLQAVQELGRAEPDAVFVMVALIEVLENDEQPEVRAAAAQSVGFGMGLRRGRGDREPFLRSLRCRHARQLAVRALIGALEDPAPEVRGMAAVRIGTFAAFRPGGPALARHGNTIKPPDRLLRSAIPGLLKAMEDPVPEVRQRALEALADLGPHPDDRLPVFLEALEQREMRDGAAYALETMGPRAAPAVPSLIGALDGTRDSEAQALVGTLGAIGEQAVPALAEALRSGSLSVRKGALNALSEMEPGAPAGALPALIEALDDDDPAVRARAAGVLSSAGPGAQEAAGALLRCLEDPEWLVRWTAAGALGDVGRHHPGTLPALINLLQDPHERPRGVAALAIGKFRADARTAVPALVAATEEGRIKGSTAASALAAIGPAAEEAVPLLVAMLWGKTAAGRPLEPAAGAGGTAARALGRIGERALPDILDRVAEEEMPRGTRYCVVKALEGDRGSRRRGLDSRPGVGQPVPAGRGGLHPGRAGAPTRRRGSARAFEDLAERRGGHGGPAGRPARPHLTAGGLTRSTTSGTPIRGAWKRSAGHAPTSGPPILPLAACSPGPEQGIDEAAEGRHQGRPLDQE